jgi:glycosyltransferase involved in cell wall biosynthesis
MKKISAVVITRNEEHNIRRCLDSLAWADEIIVIDSGSTDRTIEIAHSCGASVYSFEWKGYGPAKREGVARATGDWVLSVDADEEVPVGLRDEIRAAIGDDDGISGYLMPRQTLFLGRWLKHSGWYPDCVLRLFRREKGDFSDATVHERAHVDGPVGRLRHDLLHYSYPSLESYFDKFNRYTSMAALAAYRDGRRAGLTQILIHPPACFVKQYVVKLGFLDGLQGLLVCALSAGHVLVKYAKLWALCKGITTEDERINE